MNILVNYDPIEKPYLPILGSLLKNRQIDAKATSESFSITELLGAAKKINASGILLINNATLANCVQVPVKTQATLSTFRGSRLNFSIPAIVCAPLKQTTTLTYGKFLLERDLNKLQHLSKPPIQLGFKVCENENDFLECEQRLDDCIIVSGDIETDAHSRITCIGFTGLQRNLNTITYIIPFIDFGTDHWPNIETYSRAIECMQTVCRSSVPKMFYNGNYDVQYLIKYHAWPNNWTLDAMGLLHSQYSELEKNLAFAASLHCYDYYYWKLEDALSKKNKEIRGYWGYCAKDSWYPVRIFLNMCAEGYPEYAVKNYQKLFKLCYPCLYCAYEGFKIDSQKLSSLRSEAVKRLEKRKSDILTMAANPNFNPNSPKQIAEFIYDIIGAAFPVTKNKETSQWQKTRSTDQKILLNKIAPQHPLLARVIDDILAYRKEAKAISTYFDFAKYPMPDGSYRLLYSMSPFTTDTGRFSCSQSNFRTFDYEEWEAISYGMQIQNQPTYAKDFIIADEGMEIGDGDNNKSEARCVALLSGCIKMQTALEFQEKDFYRTLGTLFFGIPYEKVTTELRNKVLKRIVHASNYLLGVDTFILQVGPKQIYEGAALLGIQVQDLKKFVHWLLLQYHKPFPEIKRHWDEIKREIIRTRMLVSPLAYTRYFFGNIGDNHSILRAAVAHEPQNLSVDILNKGFWRIYKNCVIPSQGQYRLKAQVHDAIIYGYATPRRNEFRDRTLENMDNPVDVRGQKLIIPVDFKCGTTWKDLKEA